MSDCAEIGEAERCKHPTESLHKPYTQLPVKDVYSAPRLPNTTHHPLLFIDAEENVKKKKNCRRRSILAAWSSSLFRTCRFGGLRSSRGTISMRKSNWSNLVMAMAMSFLWKTENKTRESKQKTKTTCNKYSQEWRHSQKGWRSLICI